MSAQQIFHAFLKHKSRLETYQVPLFVIMNKDADI